jgi:hypothetical protein
MGGVTVLMILAVVIVLALLSAWMLWKAVKNGTLLLARGAKRGAELTEDALHDEGSDRHRALVEPTWGRSEDGGPPVTELTAEPAGPLSPFGEDHRFPLPPEELRYAHPTDQPNRAGLMARQHR